MTIRELMQGYIPDPNFEGFLTTDDNVLAIDISESGTADVDDYVVAAMGITGFDPQINTNTTDSQYIRTGQTTIKTGAQRTFSVGGDRYIGDPFQDFCLSHKMIYAVGNDAIRPYVFFNLKNGKGERGNVSIIVNSDNGGEAGSNATIDIGLQKAGDNPSEFVYTPAPNAPRFKVEVPSENAAALLGKKLSDFSEGLEFTSDGEVVHASGTLKHVTGFTAFNESVASEQSGYYIPFKVVPAIGATEVDLKCALRRIRQVLAC